jgi:hypothetical protein
MPSLYPPIEPHETGRLELMVVDEAGHETTTPGMLETIVGALDRFAGA